MKALSDWSGGRLTCEDLETQKKIKSDPKGEKMKESILDICDRLDRHHGSIDFLCDHIENQDASYVLQMIRDDISKTIELLKTENEKK